MTHRNLWQTIHSDTIVSRALRAEAFAVAAQYLHGDQLKAARMFLSRSGRTAGDVRQFMHRLTTAHAGRHNNPTTLPAPTSNGDQPPCPNTHTAAACGPTSSPKP